MTQAKIINYSLTLVNIYNNMNNMLMKDETLDNIKPTDFWDLVEINGKLHDAILMSLEDVTLSENRTNILNQIL